MPKIWRNRIEAETQRFEDCPAYYRDKVLELMRADVENNVISKEKFEELTGEKY